MIKRNDISKTKYRHDKAVMPLRLKIKMNLYIFTNCEKCGGNILICIATEENLLFNFEETVSPQLSPIYAIIYVSKIYNLPPLNQITVELALSEHPLS